MEAGSTLSVVPSPERGVLGASRPVGVEPVFLVGPARSGTSLLYKVLCLHPEATYISNWVSRFPRVSALASLNRLARVVPSLQLKVWFDEGSNAYVYGRRRPLWKRLFPMPVEGEPVYASCGITLDEDDSRAGSNVQAERLRGAVESVRGSGEGVFINKRIANNRRVPLLQRAFPAARFVALVRDGRAVAYSLSRVDWWEDSHVWWYGGTPRQWRSEGRDPWEMCARNWVEELQAVENGLRAVPEDRVLQLSYESFVADPLRELERVASFAGLPASPRWVEKISRLRFPNRNDRWRGELGPDAVRTITAVQAEELGRYGYA